MTNKFELDLDAIPYNTQYTGDKPPARITGSQIRWAAENCLTEHAIENGHQKILLAIADQLDPQTKPRIPEPSIYGVVEAGHPQKDGKRSNFVRIIDEGDRRHWVDETYEADLSEWDDLIDPVLVREGV